MTVAYSMTCLGKGYYNGVKIPVEKGTMLSMWYLREKKSYWQTLLLNVRVCQCEDDGTDLVHQPLSQTLFQQTRDVDPMLFQCCVDV